MKFHTLALIVLVAGTWTESARAERRGVDWYESSGEFGCLHCRLAALRSEIAEGADDVRFESGTGRDLRNFAPDRPADLKHMRLEFDVPDMNKPDLSAKQTLTLSAVARPLDVLTLNAEQMEIASVEIPDSSPIHGGTRITHSYDGKQLSIRFDPPLPPGVDADVVVRYALHDPAEGMIWTTESPEWKGRPAQIHTQGQPETNRFWFPTHDFPNERLTTEIIATVPAGFIVSANGREVTPPKSSNGRTTFHWLQDKPHVSYLVSMVIGKFDVKDVAPAGSRISMPVYVPPGKGGDIERSYKRTPEMVKVFEERFSEPYPWDRYGQVCVWNFGAGGMENTSVTTMFDTAYLDEKALQDEDLDGLISHELGHQWFGDLITCNTWAHIWLNEGWATYCSALWSEARDGGQNGYINSMWRTMRGIAKSDSIASDAKGDAPKRPGMVSPIYKHPWEVFRRASNPYPKGSSILHMLRADLGDELFFKCVAEYVDRFKLKTAETSDFRRTFEEVSGRSLERFFTQWAERPGTPKVSIKASWNEKEKELRLVIEQKQLIDDSLPAFVFDLPVEVYLSEEEGAAPVIVNVPIDAKRHERAVPLESEPKMVLIDPDLHVLMDPEVEAPADWLLRQLVTRRSIASRLDALNFVRGRGTPAVIDAVTKVMRDANEWHAVRSEAAETLGKLNARLELLSYLGDGVDSARVRRAVINALGEIGGIEVVPALAARAADENESYACRAAALDQLGKHAPRGSTEFLPIYDAALRSESQHDQVRIGAIRGLANLNIKEAMPMVIPFTRFGTPGRTRPDAIDAVSKLSKLSDELRETAYGVVAPLLFDREERAQRAAISAMVGIRDKRGVDDLDRVASTTRSEQTRDAAERARERLVAALDKDASIDATQAEVERLKADLKRLESKIDKK
ncbi:MAG: M1 family metallopeptidase [Phycisphaerae bacterium]|nr:M1 family metallopeptidase [Phycisphaerae bacterium]